jgi:polyisoprenoid-binding protein YceI
MKKWKIDPAHSEIKFKVKHLLVSTVTGQFNDFDGEITANGDNFENAKVTFTAKVSSIDTKNEQRDGHLRSADFFDSEKYPEIKFASTEFKKISDNKYKLTGDFTIKGTTKPVELDVEYNGKAKGFDGLEVAGFELSGKINRFDYGLEWNALTEAGGIVVGPDVRLEIFAEMKEAQDVSKAA